MKRLTQEQGLVAMKMHYNSEIVKECNSECNPREIVLIFDKTNEHEYSDNGCPDNNEEGRNDICKCVANKKYKHCCGK